MKNRCLRHGRHRGRRGDARKQIRRHEARDSQKTSPLALTREKSLLPALHRDPVVLSRSVPGLLVNRLQQTLYRESIYLIESGVTTAEDIDLAFKYLDLRYTSVSLLEFFDDVGLPLESSIAANVYPDLCAASEIQDSVRRSIDEGRTGKTAGFGLRDWSKIDAGDYKERKQSLYFPMIKNWNMPE